MSSHQSIVTSSANPTSKSRVEFINLTDEDIRLIAIYLEEDESRLSSLRSLSMVNKRVYYICCPLVWKKLEFPLEWSISELIHMMLPKHGRYVRSIILAENRWHGPTLKSASTASDTGRSESPDSYKDGHLTLENLTEVLSHCPNLREFGGWFDEAWKPGRRETGVSLNALLQGLVSNLAQLQQLCKLTLILGGNEHSWSSRILAELLPQLPLLKSLVLSRVNADHSNYQEIGITMLGQAVSSLKHLKELSLEMVVGLKEPWPRCPTLQSLKITSCPSFRPSDAPQFVSEFAPNLHRLEILFSDVLPPINLMPVRKLYPDFNLPSLVEIHVRVNCLLEYQLVYSLEDCKDLQYIDFWALPLELFPNFVELVCAPLWPRLKNLDLVRCYPEGQADNHNESIKNQLETFCRTQDIKLKLRGWRT